MNKDYPEQSILIVDDEEEFLKISQFILESEGFTRVITCSDSRKVEELLKSHSVGIVLLDLTMPYLSGWDILELIKRDYPDILVVIITADDTDILAKAKKSLKYGAYDYILKPIDKEKLVNLVTNLVNMASVVQENQLLKSKMESDHLEWPEYFSLIPTKNNRMKSIYQYIEAIAASPLPILITGETGTGKNVIAQVIHNVSQRRGKYVVLNIAGEDPNTVSDTLFGHIKGSFTGATSDRTGLLEQADHGTLLLDEIGDLSMDIQIKLLHILQEGKYFKIGSDLEKSVDVRFVFATNKDIEALVEEGKFRKDLFYRLKYHKINLPSLRERKEDLPHLVNVISREAFKIFNQDPHPVAEAFSQQYSDYDFPGNIRELEGMVYDAISKKEIPGGESGSDHLNETVDTKDADGTFDFKVLKKGALFQLSGAIPTIEELKDLEDYVINRALEISDQNQAQAAKVLGITRKTLNSRLLRRKNKS